MRIGSMVLVFMVICFANEARADKDCRLSRFSFNIMSEGPWPARMTVKTGKGCGSRHWTFGPTTPSRLYLLTQPKHGSVTLSHTGGYRYIAAGGYVGPDTFKLRLCGVRNGGYEGCANIQFEVSVVAQL